MRNSQDMFSAYGSIVWRCFSTWARSSRSFRPIYGKSDNIPYCHGNMTGLARKSLRHTFQWVFRRIQSQKQTREVIFTHHNSPCMHCFSSAVVLWVYVLWCPYCHQTSAERMPAALKHWRMPPCIFDQKVRVIKVRLEPPDTGFKCPVTSWFNACKQLPLPLATHWSKGNPSRAKTKKKLLHHSIPTWSPTVVLTGP